jgi:hypothetical protein
MLESEKGQEFIRDHKISPDDYCGHGTIREWFRLDADQGKERECTDFSTPDNFPPGIVKAIKDGDYRGLGIGIGLLTQLAYDEYERITQLAYAEYERIRQPAYDEYLRIRQAAYDEYERITQLAYAEYERITQAAFWDLFAIPENRPECWR